MVFRCAVVILNYKNIEATISIIEEFKNQEEEVKIVVVDNNSQDGSHEILSKLENIVYLQTNQNLGYARGNNFGINYVMDNFEVDFIVISNNDIKLPNKYVLNSVSEIVKCLPNNWGYLGTKIVNDDGSIWQDEPNYHTTFFERILNSTLFGIPFRKLFRNFNFNKKTTNKDKFYESEIVSGAFFALNPLAVKSIGPFDPYTFLYGEERILAMKYYNFGYKGYLTNNVEIIHENSSTTKKYPVISYVNSLKSEYYYFVRYCNLGAVKCSILVFIRLIDTLIRIVIGNVSIKVFGKTLKMYSETIKELK